MNEQKLADLEKRLAYRLRSLKRMKGLFKIEHRAMAMGLAVLAAANTFLVAMSQFGDDPDESFAVIALIVSGTISVVSTWESLRKPREKRGQNAEAQNIVHDIKARLEWRKLDTAPITDDEIEAFNTELREHEKEFFSAINKINLEDGD